MEAGQDEELQMALALSLQEYNNTTMPSPQEAPPDAQAGPSNQKPSPQSNPGTSAGKINSPTTETGKTSAPAPPSASGGGAAQKSKKKRAKKLPQFAPSETEIDACFKELASNERSHLTIPDIIETASKLGLDLDHEKVGAMLEYLTENRVGNDVLRTGGITLQDFRDITQHFRVD